MKTLIPLLIPLDISDIGSAIMSPLYWAVSGLMKFFHWVFAPLFGYDSGWTWVLAIAMLTVVVRSLMLPLYVRQLNQSRAMQTLQPKIQELQRKYGADRERLGQETMKLYNEEGVNPMSSCLPLLIQLPIFWALFRVLREAALGIPLGHFFVQDPQLVESLSNATIFGAGLSGTFMDFRSTGFGGTQIVSGVFIILMTALLFWQQLYMMRKNMPAAALEGTMGQQQKMMLLFMPFIYIISGPAIPLGVLLYWFFSNLWTLGQQFIIIQVYPTPNTPAYIAWEDRMIARGKDPDAIEKMRAGKVKRKKNDSGSSKPADDGKVRRQGTNRSTNISKDSRKTVARQPVVRQQTQHRSRASRKNNKGD